MEARETRNKLIVALSLKGCTTSDIKKLLAIYTGERLSLRQIQRVVRTLNKKGQNSLSQVIGAINMELKGSGSLLGYRALWSKLKNNYNLSVKRNTVMMLLAMIDEHGTAQRKSRRLKRRLYRSKGPNYAWHCDGYDKLKPFGLPIHGCIDGYSRKILWLKVSYSNNNPSFIADHYLNCVLALKGCPRILRTDLGTENSIISFLQPALRHHHTDSLSGCKSHRYGKSTSNQRIESFWAQLRRGHMEWWISFFKDLEFNNHFNSSFDWQKDLVRYVFGPVIQAELDVFVTNWNKHKIRKSLMAEVPSGIPNILFEFPELKGASDYLCPVQEEHIVQLAGYCSTPTIVSKEFQLLSDKIVNLYKLPQATDFNQILINYFTLMSILKDLL